jgi:hypothetical protein
MENKYEEIKARKRTKSEKNELPPIHVGILAFYAMKIVREYISTKPILTITTHPSFSSKFFTNI